jgi:hypothetical protein
LRDCLSIEVSTSTTGVEWDPSTAIGQWRLHLALLGPSLRASVSYFDNCLKRRIDRTDARILTWSKLEEHFHRVHAGLIAIPSYEPGVDTSSIPAVSEMRLHAQREDAFLRQWLGRDMHDLLYEVIYLQRTYRELATEGGEHKRIIGAMFKRALDAAAAYHGIGADNSFGWQVNDVLHRAEQAQ